MHLKYYRISVIYVDERETVTDQDINLAEIFS